MTLEFLVLSWLIPSTSLSNYGNAIFKHDLKDFFRKQFQKSHFLILQGIAIPFGDILEK